MGPLQWEISYAISYAGCLKGGETLSYFVITRGWVPHKATWGINFSTCLHDAVEKCRSGQKIVVVAGKVKIINTDPIMSAFTEDFTPVWNKKVEAWQIPEIFSILKEIPFEEVRDGTDS